MWHSCSALGEACRRTVLTRSSPQFMSELPPQAGRAVAVILAAGKSTRMKSRLPKAVHPICGKPMAWHVVAACRRAGVSDVVVVVGHQGQSVVDALGPTVAYAEQRQQLGTGHALMCAAPILPPDAGLLLVLPADTPLISHTELATLMQFHREQNSHATLLTAILDDPSHYGRVVRAPDGSVTRIVEAKDADADALAIREINSSIYCFAAEEALRALRHVKPNNAQGEYYLTDVIELLGKSGGRVHAVPSSDPTAVLGINHRAELAKVEALMRSRILRGLMLAGVTVTDPSSTYVDADVSVGADAVLRPGTHLLGATTVGEECTIGPCTVISNSTVGAGASVELSRVADSTIGEGASVGPYACVLNGSRVESGAVVGPFRQLDGAIVGPNA